jgi:hypothetical protein
LFAEVVFEQEVAMFYSIHFDVVGPGVLLLFGLVAFLLFSGIVFGIEAVVLWLLKWGTFGRSLLASFLMNLASTIVGVVVIGVLATSLLNNFLTFVLALLLSILIEGGVLMLVKRDATHENWRAASIANVISYALLGIFLLLS